MGHLGSHEHSYEAVRTGLTPWQMVKLISRIQSSGVYEIGDWMHIHLKGTDTCVGYLGDDSAELVDPDRKAVRPVRNKLRKYFNSV